MTGKPACRRLSFCHARTDSSQISLPRKGFFIGFSLGAGTLRLNTNDTVRNSVSTTLPNLKVGYHFSHRFSVLVLLPGANYTYQKKDRGFEALIFGAQYWPTERFWLLGGAGLTFDAAAFYTVKDPKTAGFYTGFPALTFGAGYQIWHKGRFSLDLQYRFFHGRSELPGNGFNTGMSNMMMVGFNWY